MRPVQDSQVPDTAIHSQVNGGLDIAATSLSLSSNRSPYTENTVPGEGGGVRKRKGSRLIHREPIGRASVGMSTVVTPGGTELLVAKESSALTVYGLLDAGVSRLVLKSGVFTSRAKNVRPTIVTTQNRAIFLTGTNKPVQLTFSERTQYGVSGTDVVFDNGFVFNGLTVDDLIVVVNGQVQSTFAVSYNGTSNELTVSGMGTLADATVSVIAVTWQWWTQAMQWFGSEMYGTAARIGSTTNPETFVVRVPAALTTDISLQPELLRDFGIRAFDGTQSAYTLRLTGSVSGASEYAYSDGTVPNSASPLQPTPFFVVFGGGVANDETVHFTRRRELPFKVTPGNLAANIDGQPVSILSGTSTGSYGDVVAIDSGGSKAGASERVHFVAMEQATTLGIGSLSVVQVADTTLTDTTGSKTLWRPDEGANTDGAYVPINGLHQLYDTENRFYPLGGAVYNERLVLTGSKADSSLVLVSALGDRRTPDLNYGDFQIRETNTAADGFDISVSLKSDEALLAAATWQDNLFLLSNRQTYRVAGQGGLFSAETFSIGVMTTVGLTNPQAYTSTDKGIFFVANNGLYTITSRDNLANEYDSLPKSERIQPVFDDLDPDREYDWLAYDPNTRLLYMGLEVNDMPGQARELYVYHTLLESWSHYTTPGNFHSWSCIIYNDKPTLALATKWSQIEPGALPVSFVLLQLEYDRYLDFYDTTSPDANGYIFSYAPFPAVSHQSVAGLRQYATTMQETRQAGGFAMLPMTDLQDVEVVIDGVRQTFSPYFDSPGDYVKLPNGNIFLKSDPGDGVTIDIYLKSYLPEVL